ncbi:metallophosphoesterase [Kosakonia pseudosacchari]|uniref:metallophosphoesterase n=1 Tax=Kosakonia pseudosacchari TaxID=1646340 RepID=UPI00188110FB|nr:metallophosphoesterase [Kosakonia pseudosacchari]QOV66118.1 metallophosphoesterase [Kosakonia pseudosacchari]
MLIAQLSDIHAAPENDNLQRLQRAIDWLLALNPDLLVVSGDLTDNGWSAGYRAIDSALQRLACRSLILPGNADDKTVMCENLAAFAHRSARDALHFHEHVNNVPVIGVDVTVAGESRGDIRPHLRWLEAVLRAQPQPAMVFLHQHLFPSGIAPLDNAMCEGGEVLAQLLASLPHPPLALCAGHVHRAMSATFAGIPAYLCGSICPANPLMLNAQHIPVASDPPALLIHELRGDTRVSHFVNL